MRCYGNRPEGSVKKRTPGTPKRGENRAPSFETQHLITIHPQQVEMEMEMAMCITMFDN